MSCPFNVALVIPAAFEVGIDRMEKVVKQLDKGHPLRIDASRHCNRLRGWRGTDINVLDCMGCYPSCRADERESHATQRCALFCYQGETPLFWAVSAEVGEYSFVPSHIFKPSGSGLLGERGG